MNHAPIQLPLLFTFAHVIQGKGYLAGVHMQGRALLEVSTEAGEESWIQGISPVGISGGVLTG